MVELATWPRRSAGGRREPQQPPCALVLEQPGRTVGRLLDRPDPLTHVEDVSPAGAVSFEVHPDQRLPRERAEVRRRQCLRSTLW